MGALAQAGLEPSKLSACKAREVEMKQRCECSDELAMLILQRYTAQYANDNVLRKLVDSVLAAAQKNGGYCA